MAKPGPTYDEYCDLRDKFVELATDYILVAEFNGLSGPDDLAGNPNLLAMKQKAGIDTAGGLLGMVKAMDTLADSRITANVQEWHDAWPDFIAILDGYFGVHEGFKPLRALARAWNLDIGQEVTARVGRPVGRSPGSVYYRTPESLLSWLGPHIRSCKDDGERPTRSLVAERAGYDESTLRHHMKPHFSGWLAMLAAWEESEDR